LISLDCARLKRAELERSLGVSHEELTWLTELARWHQL